MYVYRYQQVTFSKRTRHSLDRVGRKPVFWVSSHVILDYAFQLVNNEGADHCAGGCLHFKVYVHAF